MRACGGGVRRNRRRMRGRWLHGRRIVSYGCFCELGADCAEEVGDVLVAGLRGSKRVEDDESGLIAVFPFGPVDTRGGLIPGGAAGREVLPLRPFATAWSRT